VVLLPALLLTAVHAEKRIALLIGNKDYKPGVGALVNPLNDVRVVGGALKAVGFEVLKPVQDGSRVVMLRAIHDFALKLKDAGPDAVGFLYYSGHGIASAGENYLIPIDVEELSTVELNVQGVKQSEVLAILRAEAPNATHYLVLDACRNTLQGARGGKGFLPVGQQSGVLVAFAAEPGKTASDIGAGSGPYAAALVAELVMPGQNDLLMFHHVRVAVIDKTAGDQVPWTEDGVQRRERVMFGGEGNLVAAPSQETSPQSSQPKDKSEHGFDGIWGIRGVGNANCSLKNWRWNDPIQISDSRIVGRNGSAKGRVSGDGSFEITVDSKGVGTFTMTHHPHVHMIVPGGGLSPGRQRWVPARPKYLLPVKVLSRLFRRRMLEELAKAHAAAQLRFFNEHTVLSERPAFTAFLRPLRRLKWVVYAKEPFAGPEPVLRYMARYTHRVAISNRRLVSADDGGVAFRWKDYRLDGPDRWKTMTLHPHEFIRRFLMHVLPKGFHRIIMGCLPTAIAPTTSPEHVSS